LNDDLFDQLIETGEGATSEAAKEDIKNKILKS